MTLAPTPIPLLELRDFSVSFPSGMVVRSLNLSIYPGEAFGIVGESGSGKSVTWLAALGLLPRIGHVSGEAWLGDENLLTLSKKQLAKIRGGRVAMIFQDPMSALNPVKKIGHQVIESISLHRDMSREAARAEAKRLFELVGIPDAKRRLDLYPHELSGGQNQRVMIAMALAGQPELLIADEPTTALDVTIQAQILTLLENLRRELNMALVFISHDLSVVGDITERAGVMYAGQIIEVAPTKHLFMHPQHPYTRGLLAAAPTFQPGRRLTPIPGAVPEPWNMPGGCAFAPRCSIAAPDCNIVKPLLQAISPEGEAFHQTACLQGHLSISNHVSKMGVG